MKPEVEYYPLHVTPGLLIRLCSIAQPDSRQRAIARQGQPRSAIVRKVLPRCPRVQPVIPQQELVRQVGLWLKTRKTTFFSLNTSR